MPNLIKFNLERALAGDPVVTRDEREAKFLFYDELTKNDDNVVLIVIRNKESWSEIWLNRNGKITDDQEKPYDLFMKPKT